MFEFIFKIWYMIAVLPFFMLIEGNKKFAQYLKRENIYKDWDMMHAIIVALFILLVGLILNGYR